MASRSVETIAKKLPPDVARAALKLVNWAKENGYKVYVIKEQK